MSTEKKLESYLERINNVMWNSYCLKDVKFGDQHGKQIMEILEEWASQPATPPAANQEKKIVWEERRDHWQAETQGGILLLATTTHWELWKSGATIVTADAPDLPSAKAAAEKAYREHVKQTP